MNNIQKFAQNFFVTIIIFLLVLFILKTFYFSNIFSNLDQRNIPNLWDSGIYGFLFLIGITLAPRFTLIFFCSIKWDLWFLLGVLLFPEFTVIFLAFSRGYYHKNYLLLSVYCFWKIISLHRSSPDTTPSERTSIVEHVVRSIRNTDSLHLLSTTQGTINLMKRKINQLQSRISLLEMEPAAIMKLTTKQLSQLRNLMKNRLQGVEQVNSNTPS